MQICRQNPPCQQIPESDLDVGIADFWPGSGIGADKVEPIRVKLGALIEFFSSPDVENVPFGELGRIGTSAEDVRRFGDHHKAVRDHLWPETLLPEASGAVRQSFDGTGVVIPAASVCDSLGIQRTR